MEMGYKINESTVSPDGVRELKDITVYELSITEEELEWMRIKEEIYEAITSAFGIPPQLLGLHDGQIVEGTIQPAPLPLPPPTPDV